MTSQFISGDLISDRYASALYDLASELKVVDFIVKDLKSIQLMLKNNINLNLIIKSPLISSSDKFKIFEILLKKIKANKIAFNFLKVVEKNKRFSNLNLIILQFINLNAMRRGDVLADITSADELTVEQKNNVKEQLKIILGEKLSLNFIVDKKIIAGLIVKVGSKMIDTSLANKINKLKIAMKGA